LTADGTGAPGEHEAPQTPSPESTDAAGLDDAELALMLATATGMGRAQLRELIQRRARRRR